MSLDTAFARIAELNTLLTGPTAPATVAPATTTTTATPSSDDFAQMLRTASVTGTAPTAARRLRPDAAPRLGDRPRPARRHRRGRHERRRRRRPGRRAVRQLAR